MGKSYISDKFIVFNADKFSFLKGDGTLDTTQYFPTTGGSLSGMFQVNPANAGFYNEGIRVSDAPNGWSFVTVGTDTTNSGVNPDGKQWIAGKNPTGNYVIVPAGQEGDLNGLILRNSSNMTWYNQIILHAGNFNSYAPTLTGGGATGQWGIDIAGLSRGLSHNYATANSITYGDLTVVRQGYAGDPAALDGYPTADWYSSIKSLHGNPAGFFTEIAASFTSEHMYHRSMSGGTLTPWKEVIDSKNIGNQSVYYAGNSGSLGGYGALNYIRYAPSNAEPQGYFFAIGAASGRNFIQSHGGQPLDINPLGNVVTINNGIPFTTGNFAPEAKEDKVNKGQPDGYASLDGTGKVPNTQLPSYVDDVVEYVNLASFPVTGEAGKIYVALDTGKTYRWSGSAYIEISPSDVNSVNGKVGVVTLNTGEIPEVVNKRYQTDAQQLYNDATASIQNQLNDRLPRAGGSTYGMVSMYTGDTSGSYNTRALELREVGLYTSTQGNGANLAPALTFHWGGMYQKQIALMADGRLVTRLDPGSGNEILDAGNYLGFRHNVLQSKYFYSGGNLVTNATPASTLTEPGSLLTTGMFDTTGNTLFPGSYGNVLTFSGYDRYGATQIQVLYNGNNATRGIGYRNYSQNIGDWNVWSHILDDVNFSNYAVRVRTRDNWKTDGGVILDNVIGQLAWKVHGNNHTIFDASASTSPSGTSINSRDSQNPWTGAGVNYCPTLMGWNGLQTYGVRVDNARIADTATSATYATSSTLLYANQGSYGYGSGAPYYMDMTYNGPVNRWRLKVTPATPSEIEVAYADNAGLLQGYGVNTGANANSVALRDGIGDLTAREIVLTGAVSTVAPDYLVGIYPTTNQGVKFTSAQVGQFLGLSNYMLTGNSLNSLMEYTVDASTLDQNTYYPITIQLPYNRNTRIEIHATLGPSGVPGWAQHPSGFSCHFQKESIGCGWGTTNVERIIYRAQYYLCPVNPIGDSGQMNNSSLEYTYVRGGGTYKVLTTQYTGAPTLQTSSFTLNSETINPIPLAGITYAIRTNVETQDLASYAKTDGTGAYGTWGINISGAAARATRATGNFYMDDNYGCSIIGTYSATKYQGIFSMGAPYKLADDGTDLLTHYGLAWTHEYVGGQSKAGLGHQLLINEAGVAQTAIGNGIWTRANVTGRAFNVAGITDLISSTQPWYGVGRASTAGDSVVKLTGYYGVDIQTGSNGMPVTVNGNRILDAYNVGDYALPKAGGDVNGKVWFTYGRNPDRYSWVDAAVTTNSIEIVGGESYDVNYAPTLAFHNYGSGGPQFRLAENGHLWLETAFANSARKQNNGAGATNYFNALRLTPSDPNGIYINGNPIVHAGNISSQSVNNAVSAKYVNYLPNRTDAATYPILWGASQGTDSVTGNQVTYAFSCAAVTINSSVGEINANGFRGTLFGNATTATTAAFLYEGGTSSGATMRFNWAGNVGGMQPTWLWGGNDGVNHYVYNPYNFNVANAREIFGNDEQITAGNVDSTFEGTNRLYVRNFYNLQIPGVAATIGTVLGVNGLGAHDKTQFIFNGGNGGIQYRKSWYNNTPWTEVRTIVDSNNLSNYALPIVGGTMSGMITIGGAVDNSIRFANAAQADLYIGARDGTRIFEIRNNNYATPNYAACGLHTGDGWFDGVVEAVRLTTKGQTVNATLGGGALTWGGETRYPALYGSTPDKWIMHFNPHIVYTDVANTGGGMTGATIRMGSNTSASFYWDIGVGTSGVGPDRFAIGREGVALFTMRSGGETIIGGTGSSTGHKFQVYGDAYIEGVIVASGGNSNQWNTAYSWGNHAGRYPTYDGGGAGGTWNISITGNANYATTAGSAPNGNNQNPFYYVTPGEANGLAFWGSSTYKISMGSGAEYQYGAVSGGYSIKTTMNPIAGWGFTWGATGQTPIASLEVTTGNFYVAGTIVTASNGNSSIWNGKVSGSGTANYVSKWSSSIGQSNSQIFDNGTYVGINTTTNLAAKLQVVSVETTTALFGGGSTSPCWVGLGTANSSTIPYIQAFANNFVSYPPLGVNLNGGNVLVGTTTDSGYKLRVAGTVYADGNITTPATITAATIAKSGGTAKQYLMANGTTTAVKYDVYTVKVRQTAPGAAVTITTLDNTIGGAISTYRQATGIIRVLSDDGWFNPTPNKTIVLVTMGSTANVTYSVTSADQYVLDVTTRVNNVATDAFEQMVIEVRTYY